MASTRARAWGGLLESAAADEFAGGEQEEDREKKHWRGATLRSSGSSGRGAMSLTRGGGSGLR